VIVKGGHLEGPYAVDILFDGQEIIELKSARIASTSTHGTGCTFASAVTANLALGLTLREAARRAKDYVVEGIRRAPQIGSGHGPLAHFR
jgi:hydroxymethylpyrimidine kinase/phosphomethylpyrimidine kinase